MIIAATDAGISISTDGGLSWRNSAANGLGYGINCIVVSNSIIYAATEAGLSVSTDRGESWTTYTKANGLGDTPGSKRRRFRNEYLCRYRWGIVGFDRWGI